MQKELHQFLKQVNEIHGLFLDSTSAFSNWYHQLLVNQKHFQESSGKSEEVFNEMHYIYCKEQQDGKIKPLGHSTKLGELKKRNAKGGENHISISNYSLVLIFHCWEDCRNDLKKRTTKTVDSDLLGDIRLIRNSILKHQGRGNKEMERCKIITKFKKDQKIEIDEDYFEEIINLLKKEVNVIEQKYFT